MKLSVKKNRFETFLIFIIVPLLSIPTILLQIIRKDKWGGYFTALLFGILGFLYIPSVSNDKTRYYERFELFKDYSFEDFRFYLFQLKKPDFIFDTIIFTFSKLNIPLEFAFLLLTSLCVILVLKIVNKVINLDYTKNKFSYLYVVVLVCISFSLPGLLSGLRFTLGASILLYGFFQLLILKKKKLGFLTIFIASQVHFSLLFFIPLVLLLNSKFYSEFPLRLLFIISIGFFLIPASFTTQFLGFFSFSESLSSKTSLYTEGDDFISQNFDTNQGSYLMYLIRGAWYYVMIFILLLFPKRLEFDSTSTTLIKMLYLMIFLTNITYSFPTIFTRYILLIKMVFAIYLIYLYVLKNSLFTKQVFFLILLLYLMSFSVDVYVLRYNFIASLFSGNNFFLFNILSNKIEYNEFLQ